MADLTTLTRVKLQLKIDPADTDSDTFLSELIADCSDAIQEFTGRTLTPVAGAQYTVDTAAGSVIAFPKGVRAVTALGVAASDQPDTGGSYTAVAAADILIRPNTAYRKPGWPGTEIWIRGASARLYQALNGAQLTLDEGFAVTPPGIQRVADDAIANAFQNRRPSGNYGPDDAQGAIDWTRYLLPHRGTLNRYRAGAGMGVA